MIERYTQLGLLAIIALLLVVLIVQMNGVRHILRNQWDCGEEHYTPCHITGTVEIKP